MFGKKKTKLGIHSKARKSEEISREYNQNALELGHKLTLLAEIQEEVEKLEAQIEAHVKVMRRARLEAKHLPPAPPAEAENTPGAVAQTMQSKSTQTPTPAEAST